MAALGTVALGTGRTAKQLALGAEHTCALLDNATVKCWGRGDSGQLGYEASNALGDAAGEMGQSLPAVALGTGRTAVSISAGDYHTCAVLDNGSLKCWGSASYGQLGSGGTAYVGDGANEMGDKLSPVSLGTSRSAVQVSAAKNTTCVLLDDYRSVKCFGDGTVGTLGYGNTTSLGDGPNEMGDNLGIVPLD